MKRHALFVGVNNYADSTIQNLNYSSEDATELASVFRHLLKFDRVEKLINPGHSPEIVDAVNDMTRGLGTGDLFLFFFAGHGFRVKENHVLVCAKDEFLDLEDEYAGLQVGRLKKRMRGPWNRMIVLDACQNDIRATRGGDYGIASRDLELIHARDEDVADSGVQIVITSCSEGEKALESSDLKHGLFTSAFLDAVTSVDGKSRGVNLESLRMNVGARMNNLINRYNLSGKQTPMFTMPPNAGDIILLDGEISESDVQRKPLSHVFVVCPICGKKNLPADTFRCRECGSDNLCLRHQDEKTFLCFNCAEKGTQKVVTVVEERKEVKANSGTQSAISCNSGEGNPSRRPMPMKGFWRDEGVDFPSCSDMALQFFWRAWYLKTEECRAVAFNTFMCADLEDAEIQYRIGLMLDGGWMGDNRRDEAIKWYKAAANQGHYMGLNGIAEISRRLGLKEEEQKGYKLALASMDDAAEKGDGRAMYHIGRYLRFGYIDGYENPKVGISWWEKSSEFGNAEAQYWLSKEYENGSFIEKNIGKSFLLCKAAAEGGYGSAMRRMGKFFETGVPDVIEINLKESLKWYQFSSERDRGLSIDDINRVTRLLKG